MVLFKKNRKFIKYYKSHVYLLYLLSPSSVQTIIKNFIKTIHNLYESFLKKNITNINDKANNNMV